MKKNPLSVIVNSGPQSNYLITVTVTAEEKSTMRTAVLLEYQKDATKAWFRKWHVPLPMVEQMLNPGAIMMASIEEFVNRAIQQAVEQYPNYKWIGQPYGLDTSKYEHDQSGTLSFYLDVYPDIVEKDEKRKKVKKDKYKTDVSQDEIDATVNQLQSSYATFEDAAVIEPEVLTRVKLTYAQKKDTIWHTKNHYIGWEDLEANADLKKLLLGKKIGDSVSIEYKKVQMMNGFTYTDDTDHTPTDITLEVIDTKKKVLPELNQEFIDKVFTKDDNISSVEVLMSKIKETLSLNKENNALSQWIGEYLEAVDNSFTIMIPQTLIDEEMKNRLQHLSQQLGWEKGLQAYLQRMWEEKSAAYLEEIKQAGVTSMRRFFIMKHIAEVLKIDIDWTAQDKDGEIEKKFYDTLTQ